MKSIYTFAAAALIITASAANAQTTGTKKPVDPCAQKQVSNAEVIARAQAAATPEARKAILKTAIDADPANAVCIADLALQMSLATGINPAAGPEEFGDTPTTTDGTDAPAENPNQLNQPTGGTPASPAAPVVVPAT